MLRFPPVSRRRPAASRKGAARRAARRTIAGRLRNERGAVILLVMLSIGAMLGMLALAVDIAVLFTARSEAQRAADAAALAGASGYREYDPKLHPLLADDRARDLAYDYAIRNTIRGTPIDSSEVFLETMLEDYKIRVTIRRPAVELGFARIFGISSLPVAARAAAIADPGNRTASCIKPFGIPDMWEERDPSEDKNGNQVLDFGVQSNPGGGGNGGSGPNEVWEFDPANDGDVYDPSRTGIGTNFRDHNNDYRSDEGRRFPLKFQQPGGGGEPSNWGALDLSDEGEGQGVTFYEHAIVDCVTPEHVFVNGRVRPKNGQVRVPTARAIRRLVDQDPDAYWDEELNKVAYPSGSKSPYAPANTGDAESWRLSPRVITAVVFNPHDLDPGNSEMRIVNLAQFFLEDPARVYPAAGQFAPITGRLLRYTPGGLGGGGSTGSLLRVPRLVE